MILKIDTNRNKVDEKGRATQLEYNDYWIFGEIERIHHKTFASGGSYNYGYNLELFCLNSNGEEDKNEEVLHIAIRFADDKKDIYNILLQGCTCYLCNNDGKTIDKLVC